MDVLLIWLTAPDVCQNRVNVSEENHCFALEWNIIFDMFLYDFMLLVYFTVKDIKRS